MFLSPIIWDSEHSCLVTLVFYPSSHWQPRQLVTREWCPTLDTSSLYLPLSLYLFVFISLCLCLCLCLWRLFAFPQIFLISKRFCIKLEMLRTLSRCSPCTNCLWYFMAGPCFFVLCLCFLDFLFRHIDSFHWRRKKTEEVETWVGDWPAVSYCPPPAHSPGSPGNSLFSSPDPCKAFSLP